ncbi:Pyruvate kinase [Polyrhizophydium stewartii]|uniref:Pyruvate kinase n=1 Tax=Polyrhizophydium stewartii TaxID=2732419 RepID=A0ABR4NJV2_9FUNG
MSARRPLPSVQDIIRCLREYTDSLEEHFEVAVWIDINGPKVRTGKLAGGKPVHLKKGDEFFFVNDDSLVGDNTKVATTYTRELVRVGDKLKIDDGLLSFTVVERLENSIRTIVENNGILGENKGINFPERTIEDLPAISEKDRKDMLFAMKQDVDFISISCIRDIQDAEEVRMLLGNSQIKMLAKIENQRALSNFESILRVADGIVIDRGYLGSEVDVDIIAIAQKKMVAMANAAGKPILIANQVLESMVSNPRPTRSESADVANAVMDGVDGLVLSAETAVGEYVDETVKAMRKIAYQAELNTNYLEYQMKAMRNVPKPVHVNESIASSAVLCARQVGATIIMVITEAGGTARLVAKYRPLIPVVAATTVRKTARQLSANFGLVPYYHSGHVQTVIKDTLTYARDIGLCKAGDIAVVTSGQVIGFLEGTTTKMQLVRVPS